jgi:hypothetical protein
MFKKSKSNTLMTVFDIALQLRQEGYDGKTISELLHRLEMHWFPEDFEEVK